MFDKEFKQNAVRLLVVEDGVYASRSAKDLDIGVSTLQRWVCELKAHGQSAFPDKGFFDAVYESHLLNKIQRERVIRGFLERVLENGWKDLVLDNISASSKKKSKKIVVDDIMVENVEKILYSGLTLEKGRYVLTKKFTAELPQTLHMAVDQLEQLLDTSEPDEALAPTVGSSSATSNYKPS